MRETVGWLALKSEFAEHAFAIPLARATGRVMALSSCQPLGWSQPGRPTGVRS
jgi:hypothetical protein